MTIHKAQGRTVHTALLIGDGTLWVQSGTSDCPEARRRTTSISMTTTSFSSRPIAVLTFGTSGPDAHAVQRPRSNVMHVSGWPANTAAGVARDSRDEQRACERDGNRR
jgi:hypothetical protein